MKDIVIKYDNGEVTIVWQPAKCIHSANCFRGLPDVFNPIRRPWVDPHAATTDEIVAQIRRCPSGALSFTINADKGVRPDNVAPDGESAEARK